MVRSNISFLTLILAVLVSFPALAKENIGISGRAAANYSRLASDCNDATTQIDLDINNARVRILGAGDFWWDLNDAVYEIPKVDPTTGAVPVSSMFAGALWIGGIDAGGQLKIAAQTYRQSGNDFWPGPLNPDGTVSQDICSSYDKHWKVTRQEIDDFLELAALGTPINIGSIPQSILEWPAKGNPYARGKNDIALTVDRNLAPFVDNDAVLDGLYDPTTGDYPDVDGDQAIFWVYNDKGNIHTETGGEALGLEIQAVAFGFQTSDEVNDMTFYRYNVLNFSSSPLDSTYFGQWVDADLGAFDDDFVGCDTTLGLGMCYNGDAVDGPTSPNYGSNPPIVGTDFFQGPKKFFFDTAGTLDSVLLGMSAFLYYDNDFSITGNPEVAAHYYGYLTGSWKDGTRFTEGGDGYGGSTISNFLFPANPSDPPPAWSECAVGNTPFDRRYLQSSGPFRLDPGAKNEVVVGVVWVSQSNQVGCSANFDLIKSADEKAQALFDSDFKLIDGPDAPDMTIRELDKEVIISLTNSETSNNIGEAYEEADPIIKKIVENDTTGLITDSTYNFQGYIIYQLADGTVSNSEFDDPDKARVIAQVDLNDGVDKLVNFTFDQNVGADVPTLEVDGNDEGILHTFQVTEDAFAAGDKTLINHKTYYFSVVSYAYNNFKDYDPADPNTQKSPYLEGRKNIKLYTAIPHISAPENNGTVLNSAYGDGPELKRLDGFGNGGQILEITAETEAQILQNGAVAEPVYQGRSGPIDVMVYDPLKVPVADFEIEILDPTYDGSDSVFDAASSSWRITNLTTGESVNSDLTLDQVNEQILDDWGLAITAKQVGNPGGELVEVDPGNPSSPVIYQEGADNNGLLDASIEYENASAAWLTGVPDGDAQSFFNWVRSGIFTDNIFGSFSDYSPNPDENQVYETVLGGTIAPFALVAESGEGTSPASFFPGSSEIIGARLVNKIAETPSIDLVFTSDKSKWTRSPVVASGDDPNLDPYGDEKNNLRSAPSVDRDGNPDGSGNGMGWFPGYAINLETGQRMNIIFGENPFFAGDGGDDMIWNPSDRLLDQFFNQVYGGMQYIFVHNSAYDEGASLAAALSSGSNTQLRNAYGKCTWVSMPYLIPGTNLLSLQEGLIPTETRVRLRTTKSFSNKAWTNANLGFPKYSFSTAGLAATVNDATAAESALDLINVVPNPYYAFSAYETSQLDNTIKVTNLPPNATVTIYSLDGTMIRRFVRDVVADNTSGSALGSSKNLDSTLDWDLKNSKNIPIASGVYLIHVDAGELGERTLKWFGVIRPIDLDTF